MEKLGRNLDQTKDRLEEKSEGILSKEVELDSVKRQCEDFKRAINDVGFHRRVIYFGKKRLFREKPARSFSNGKTPI